MPKLRTLEVVMIETNSVAVINAEDFDPKIHKQESKVIAPSSPDISQKIKEAFESLDHNNDDHWTAAGLPSLDDLKRISGENVTRKLANEILGEDAKRVVSA